MRDLEFSTYIKNILHYFISKEETFYDKRIKYDYNTSITGYVYSDGNYNLISVGLLKYIKALLNENNKNFIVLDGNYVYIKNLKFKKYTPEEFKEEYFALSTTYEDFVLDFLKLSTEFNSFQPGDGYCIMINICECNRNYDILRGIDH